MKMINKYDWDLEAILENGTYEDLFKNWERQINKIIKLYPTFLNDLSNFKKWIFESQKLSKLSNRISNYISNKQNEDITNENWIYQIQKISKIENDFSVLLSDYENLIIKNCKKIYIYLLDKSLTKYKLNFDSILRYKKYQLSKIEEKLISRISKSSGGVSEIYHTLIDSDIKFDDAIDTKGKKHKIYNQSDVIINSKSRDRELRKTSYISFNKAYYDFRVTLTHSLYYTYLKFNNYAQIYGYKDYISSTCFSDEIKISLIETIYSEVKKYKSSYESFIKHRNILLKNKLNLKKLEPWDLSVDLTKTSQKYTIEEAQEIVLQAVKIMGKEYSEVVRKSFTENWISWLPKKNKRSGAYSIGGTNGLKKFYILMNFDNTLESVFTLAHELGHSLNSYFYTKGQEIYRSCSIFCAEIASITNEMLLNHYLLNKYSKNKNMQKFILEQLISGFFATTSRQIIFSNFEYIANDLINNNKPFVAKTVEDTYLKLIEEYLGNNRKDWSIPYKYSLITPLRIPHFYAGNFYVYKYAIGQVVAAIVSQRIIDGDKKFLNKYYDFLKSGCSLSPLDTVRILGIDLTKKEPWEEAKIIIDSYIKIFKKLN